MSDDVDAHSDPDVDDIEMYVEIRRTEKRKYGNNILTSPLNYLMV